MQLVRIQQCGNETNETAYKDALALFVGNTFLILNGEYIGDCLELGDVTRYFIIHPDYEAEAAILDAKPWL